MDEKVWCCRTQGEGRQENYKYGSPVSRCSVCFGCLTAKDYPIDPRTPILELRGLK